MYHILTYDTAGKMLFIWTDLSIFSRTVPEKSSWCLKSDCLHSILEVLRQI